MEAILKRIEDEEKNKVLSTKIYRYAGLVQAIEFFSQKLVAEQIIESAFDFINELLLVDNSAIYVIENDEYVAKRVKGFTKRLENIENTIYLRGLATLYGNIIYEREKMIKFFDSSVIELLEIDTIIPMIIEDKLYGFILLQNKNRQEDDCIIAEALMRLISNALENYNRYEKLSKLNSELDAKVFNLFAINQSSKMLLSELNIDVLYSISVDVFSELTQSKVTGFVLFDENSGSYVLKSFRDVFYKTKDIIIRLIIQNSHKINPNKVIINLKDEQDCEYFNSLFNQESTLASAQLEQLEAKFVVLILKDSKILGFVTLSETVTDSEYSAGIFELINSLASSTYTALSNAKLFKVVNEQKSLIQKKLDKIISLNKLTRNIGSSLRADTLLEVTATTLQISFNVEKGALCLYKKETNEFELSKTINLEMCNNKMIVPNQKWKRVFEGDCIFALGQTKVAEYLGEEYIDEIGVAQGVLIIPIYIDRIEIELLGVMVIFKYEDLQLDNEENLLILDTIAGNVAPVLNNLLIIQQQQRFMLPNFIELFKKDLKEEIKTALDYNINLFVIQIEDDRDFLFKDTSVLESLRNNFRCVYPFSYNNIFIIGNENDTELEARLKSFTKIEDLKIKKMVLGREFQNFAQFFEIYK